MEDEFVVAGDGEAVLVAGVADEEDFRALEEFAGIDRAGCGVGLRGLVARGGMVGGITHFYIEKAG